MIIPPTITENKKQKTILTFKNEPLTILYKADYNFFNQKFSNFKIDNKIDLFLIIESLDSKTFSKQIFNYLLKIESEKVLQSIFEKFFEIFFDPIFQSQNTKNSFNLLFEDSSYSNILHRKYVFFPYNFSIAIYQQKLIDSIMNNKSEESVQLLNKISSKIEPKKKLEEEINNNIENNSIKSIIKRSKNIHGEISQSYLEIVRERLNALINKPEILSNEIDKPEINKDIDNSEKKEGIKTIKLPSKNPIQKNLFEKNREIYSEILNPERFFDETTKHYLLKLSNLYTQESLLYLSVLLRIVPFDTNEKLELVKEKNLFIKLLDAENYQVRIQTLITMFLFIDSVELFEAYFDNFIDSLYDESDIVIDVASEFIKLLCFKYKSSIESEAFLSLEFMINTNKEKSIFKESKTPIYLLKDANLQLTLLSSVNTNFKFLKYLYELENYAIQIKELLFCIRNNFELLNVFFNEFINSNFNKNIFKNEYENKIEIETFYDVVLSNLSLNLLIQKNGIENISFIPLLILFVEFGLKYKKFQLTAAENKKKIELFESIYGEWFHEMNFNEFCNELKIFKHVKYFMKPTDELKEIITELNIKNFKIEFNNLTRGLKNISLLRLLLNLFLTKNNDLIKEHIIVILKSIENPTNSILQFLGIINFINSPFINFINEVFKTNSKKIYSIENIINFDKEYNLLFMEKYLYLFKTIEIKRVDCFSREFKFKLAFFGDNNSNLFYRIPNSINEKENISIYFKVNKIVEGRFFNNSDNFIIELIIKKDEKYIIVDTESIKLSKSLL